MSFVCFFGFTATLKSKGSPSLTPVLPLNGYMTLRKLSSL